MKIEVLLQGRDSWQATLYGGVQVTLDAILRRYLWRGGSVLQASAKQRAVASSRSEKDVHDRLAVLLNLFMHAWRSLRGKPRFK